MKAQNDLTEKQLDRTKKKERTRSKYERFSHIHMNGWNHCVVIRRRLLRRGRLCFQIEQSGHLFGLKRIADDDIVHQGVMTAGVCANGVDGRAATTAAASTTTYFGPQIAAGESRSNGHDRLNGRGALLLSFPLGTVLLCCCRDRIASHRQRRRCRIPRPTRRVLH